MSRKPLVLRALARRDVETAVDHYANEAGRDVALGFIDALQVAYRLIADYPAIGSPRHGENLALPGLRSRSLKTYSYVVFYVELHDKIDIWRVLHAKRDIPAALQGND